MHGRGHRRLIRARAAVLGLLALVSLSASGGGTAPRHLSWAGADTGGAALGVVTHDPGDSYDVALDGSILTVRAGATNRGINTRVLVWPHGVPASSDGESCATWVAKSGPNVQLGAALRITREGDRVRAVTLTQNVIGVQWTFNVHTWDTAREGAPYELVAQHDMSSTFLAGGIPPAPWHLCVRVLGPVLEFKVWAGDESDPGWGDPLRGGSSRLPPGWDHAGQSGWYVGHLLAGEGAGLSDLSTWSYDARPRTRTRARPPAVSPGVVVPSLW